MNKRLSLTKNSLNILPVKKVFYYIPKKVIDEYNKRIEKSGKEYEHKNFKPNVLYKLPGEAYINKKLEIHIINSQPTGIYFNEEKLGYCIPESSDKNTHVLWRVHNPEIDDVYKDYIVKTSLINHGFLSGRTWEVYDSQGNLIKDLTDYNKWS